MSTEIYKIERPTTKQLFDAIIDNKYVPLAKLQPKAKQINVLLLDYFNTDEVLVTFSNVTNCGGCPIFLCADDSMYDIACENNEDFEDLSDEDKNNEIELLSYYLTSYNKLFNL